MNILTKIFVVLVTILSVALVAVLIPFAAKTEDYNKKWVDASARADLAERSAAEAQRTVTQAVQAKDAAINNLTLDNAKLRETITGLQANVSTANLELQSERGSSAANQAELKRLASTLQQTASIVEAQKTELDSRRDDSVKQQTRLIQLVDRNNELEGQLEILNRQVRRFNEQLTASEEERAKLDAIVASMPKKTETTGPSSNDGGIEPASKITGQITAVQKINAATFVQINVGSNDGVMQNTKFYIHRNGVFLGTLVVTAVDNKAASGRITLQQADIQVGDAVLTGTN